MASNETAGTSLLRLKARSGFSLEQIAAAADYKGKSSIQEYFKETYVGPLGTKAASRLASALAGHGVPPITRDEITALAGIAPPPNASVVRYEGASLADMDEIIEVYGTSLGAAMIVEGEAIEQTNLNTGDVIERRPRPVMLNRKKGVYGLYVQGSSMHPAHDDGDFVVVLKDAPLSINDDVVLYLRPTDETDDGDRATQVLIKRLVKRTAHYIELRQYDPPSVFRLASEDVLRMDKVLRLKDILS